MGSWAAWQLPFLDGANHQETSRATGDYNCIAWAMGENDRWWWPNPLYYWPVAPAVESIDGFIAAFALQGYVQCANGDLEDGVEKVVLYAIPTTNGPMPTHASRQKPDGTWTSKLGPCEDIMHTSPEAVNGPVYGEPLLYFGRPK